MSADSTSPGGGNNTPTPTTAAPLIKLDKLGPNDTISFRLDPNNKPSVSFRVSNISDSYVAVKIRTTAPLVYLVRSCSMVLSPSDTTDGSSARSIDIEVKQEEFDRLCDEVKEPKHRFQVLHRIITKTEYNNCMLLSSDSNKFYDIINRIWDQPQDGPALPHIRIRVEFNRSRNTGKGSSRDFDGQMSTASNNKIKNSSDGSVITSNKNNNNNYNNNSSDGGSYLGGRDVGGGQRSSNHVTSAAVNDTARDIRTRYQQRDVAIEDMANLSIDDIKKKYDEMRKRLEVVVEYSVALTADRDQKSQELEFAQKQLKQELTKKTRKGDSSKDSSHSSDAVVMGFSHWTLIIIGIIAFVLGYYLKK